jgi:hypothetical protein
VFREFDAEILNPKSKIQNPKSPEVSRERSCQPIVRRAPRRLNSKAVRPSFSSARFAARRLPEPDRKLEDLGKVAEIVESESPLKIGLKGTFKEHRFELTGRAQNRHELGGFWDEWYATFSNGWVGWLAEAQGKFYLTFYQPLPNGARVPSFETLQLRTSRAGNSE